MQQTIEGFRLSPQQVRLWQLQKQSDAYNSSCTILIEGELNSKQLQNALERLIARHEIYRTAFYRLPGLTTPVQVIHDTPSYNWQVGDLSNCPPPEQDRQVKTLAYKHPQIDKEQGTFLHCILLTLSTQKHILLTHFSVLHVDTPTLYLFIHDLAHFYANSHQDELSADEEIVQYAQFAEWQNSIVAEKPDDEELIYWQQHISQTLLIDPLPGEKKLYSLKPFTPVIYPCSLSPVLYARITQWLEEQLSDWYLFLLACWQILLWRLIEQKDVSVHLAVDGRIDQELAEAAGPISRWLPFVGKLHANITFLELLDQIMLDYEEFLLHASSFPWPDEITTNDMPGQKHYPMAFEFSNYPPAVVAEQVTFMLHHHTLCQEPFKIKMMAIRNHDNLDLELHYHEDLFDRNTIRNLAERFLTLLKSAIHNPTQLIGELDFIGPEERQQILVTFNQTTAPHSPYPPDTCIHHLFEQQADRTPDTIAVEYEERQLTCTLVNRRANQLASYLQSLGVQPDTTVGLYMERSPDLIISILGILKAGAAYVPCDLGYPTERLAFVSADAHLSFILTKQQFHAQLPQGVHPIYLDREWEHIAQLNKEQRPVSSVKPQNLAYLLYTSGSTGTPKGIMIPHEGLVHYVNWASQYYEVSKGIGTPLHSPLAFDLTVTSLFPSLIVGRRVILVPEEPGIEALGNVLRTHGDFSLIKITPAHLSALNHYLDVKEFAHASRVLVIGGEMLHSESLASWHQHAPNTRLINEYGPTETVVGCCIYEVSNENQEAGNIPIGRPLPNTQLYLLDANFQPVPVGLPGELYIGGIGLGRGYHRRPELTAEQFLPNPFSNTPGARLYKTGDLARFLSDMSTVEFLGRTDDQVKLRGFRVELSEIEVVLGQHAGVSECVVLLRKDEQRGAELVSYFVSKIQSVLIVKELRDFLQARLPAYMLPSAFIQIQEIPLTVNGKVDRQALLAYTSEDTHKHVSVAPRTPIEEIVLSIWEELLRRTMSVHDDFFHSGGHSLLAAQFFARIRTIFQIELPLRSLFDASTTAKMAMIIEQELHREQLVTHLPLNKVSREQALPLSFAQQRLWFLEQLEPGNTAYLIANALRIHGELVQTCLESSLQEIIQRHEILRTTFHESVGTPIQIIHSPRPFHLPMIDLRGLPREKGLLVARTLACEEEQHPCDLEHGPLLRIFLLQLAEQEHILLITFHHIICDAWSYNVFLHELTVLYQATIHSEPSPLPPLTLHYADFAHWQRSWLQGEALTSLLSYWQQQLSGHTMLDLPTDYPRPPLQTFNGKLLSDLLPLSLQQDVQDMCRREGITLFMFLLGAFQVLLARYTGQNDISIGTPIGYRTHTELEKLIGIFVNTLVIRTDLSDNPGFHEVLRRVREVALGAYAHHEAPFEQLVEILQPERDLSRSPLFQVMFVLQQERNMPETTMPALSFQPINQAQTTAKFDLTLFITPSSQGLYCTIEYNTDLFADATISRMLEHWHILLTSIVNTPEVPIHFLSLLTTSEKRQILQSRHENRLETQPHSGIHEFFIQQARKTPDTIAVVHEQHAISYSCLEQLSDQLAHTLHQQGITPDVVVGVCIERSIPMMVAILSILKAGGAYLPLDPFYPPARLAYMLDHARVPLVLTQQKFTYLIEPSIPVIILDSLHALFQPDSIYPSFSLSHPAQLAYTIYTSGSTGYPKGVTMPHQALYNLLHWQRQHSNATSGTRTLQFSALSFDVACQELFTSWSTGGTIHLISEEIRREPQALMQFLHQECIQRIFLPFVALQQLAQTENSTPYLEEVITAGEQLQSTMALRQFFARHPNATLWNQYGPSESHVVTAFKLTQPPEMWSQLPSIGTSIDHVQIYLLNKYLQPVPMGAIGEIFIGGPCLARGYLFSPATTADKFRPDPYSGQPGNLIYQTGDLARYDTDGTLQFLGRRDHQAKIRGYRIELGEIETILSQHSTVRENVVTLQASLSEDKKLVAYIVTDNTTDVADTRTAKTNELRSYLLDRLPAYMVPSIFVILDKLPLTPSGKVDRRMLPSIQYDHKNTSITHVRDTIEAQLELIWREVLETENIGVTETFFELGGHSLLAVKLMARLKKQFAQDIPLSSLFQYPTIEKLATLLRQKTTTADGEALVPIQPHGNHLPFFCVHPAGGTVFRYYLLSHFIGSDYPFYGLQTPDLDGEGTTFTSIEELAKHYIEAIQRVQPQGPYLLGGWSMGGVIAFEMAYQLRQLQQEVSLLALIDSVVENLPGATIHSDIPLNLNDDAIAQEMLIYYGISFPADLKHASPTTKLTYALEQFKRYQLIPHDTDLPQVRRLMRIGVSNLYAFRTYQPTTFPQQLTLFRAQEEITQEEPSTVPFGRTRSRSWEMLTSNSVEIHTVPGNHSTILNEPHVRTLATLLQEHIHTSRNR